MSTEQPHAAASQEWDWGGDDDDWVPPPLDTTKPSPARVYDYFLGGKDNYPVDRAMAGEMLKALPHIQTTAVANRGFLVRSVRLMAEAGVRQFIDLGTGIPTSPNVHEIAHEVIPDARVVYVDLDPIVLAHNRALLARRPTVTTIQRDMRRPGAVLSDPKLTGLIDFSEPVGLLMVGVLHFVAFDVAPGMVTSYMKDLVPGSYLAISTVTRDGTDPAAIARLEAVAAQSSMHAFIRTGSQIEALFDGTRLLEPGVVDVGRWRSDEPSGSMRLLCGVGVKE